MEQGSASSSDTETPLLKKMNTNIVGDGSTDLKGRPVSRSTTGGWSAALLIIGMEIADRLAYYGVASNLVSYLTDVMQESTATAATNVNVWSGMASILSFIGAFVADTYLGRYWTLLVSTLVYLLGLLCLVFSATLPFLRPSLCDDTSYICPGPSAFQVGFFFISLYLVDLGQAGHKPCLQPFGADQFDEEDPTERKRRSSFFNWWYFGMNCGLVVSVPVVVYVEENVGWGVGFGIPTVAMAIALAVFVYGRRVYRHKLPSTSPVTRVVQVFVAATRKRNVSVPSQGARKEYLVEEPCKSAKRKLLPTNQLRFLDKATVVMDSDYEYKTDIDWRLCTVTQVEEVKLVLRLLPIWLACLMYGVVFQQYQTFFTKQGSTLDRRIAGDFKIPAATLQSFITLSILVLLPVYDRVFVPLARRITGNERGITMLQRIGVGMFLAILSMVVAALVEMKRLRTAKEYGLVDTPQATIPMSICWLLPQYILLGVSDVFATVGLQEFFYDQMPDALRSFGTAIYLSIFGVAGFLSAIIISIIKEVSSQGNGQNWFANNLNKAHLDYYYWLLAGLSALFLCIYASFASCFIYKKAERNDEDISTTIHLSATQ